MLRINKTFKEQKPIVYVVGTPIGNLQDFSLRAVEVLKAVQKIYCEDTRTSKVLLDHYQIKNTLSSLHKFNEAQKFTEIFADLQEQKNVALISDAGVPCVSDPGAKLLNLLTTSELEFQICPVNCGPAYVHAMIMTGFEAKEHLFLGFLDKKPTQLREQLTAITKQPNQIVAFYESVHRVEATINILKNTLTPTGRIAVVREITKLNEENICGSIAEVSEYINSDQFVKKGEFVIVLDKNQSLTSEGADQIDYFQLVQDLIASGFSKKDAIKEIAKKYGLNKNEFYKKNHNL